MDNTLTKDVHPSDFDLFYTTILVTENKFSSHVLEIGLKYFVQHAYRIWHLFGRDLDSFPLSADVKGRILSDISMLYLSTLVSSAAYVKKFGSRTVDLEGRLQRLLAFSPDSGCYLLVGFYHTKSRHYKEPETNLET